MIVRTVPLVADTAIWSGVTLGLLVACGLVLGVRRSVERRRVDLLRVAEEVEVVARANPGHRLDTERADALAPLVAAVNRLADERERAEKDAAASAQDLRREVESERNRLADLMARLGVAVVVCNVDGRVLLYNDSARSLVGDPSLLGLGRTVFGVVDRGLLDHARRRLEAGEGAYTAITLHRGRMLRVHVAPVHQSSDIASAGLVLVLEDRTHEVSAADRRQRELRLLTEETRGSLGSIRAAADALLEFPDLSDQHRRRFLAVVLAESDRLGRRLDEASAHQAPGADRLDEISATDLVALLADRLRREGVDCQDSPSLTAPAPWLHVDGHALAAVLAFVVGRRGGAAPHEVGLHFTATPAHLRLDLRWSGEPPAPAELAAWLDEPMGAEGTTTGRQVLERHAAEVWAGRDGPGAAHLSMLLPRADDGAGPARAAAPDRARPTAPVAETAPGSRPEFYDFDLFGPTQVAADPWSRRLEELTFTVLDTETTGLDPTAGDRIVSIGAVRVMNGRVLRQETFERLVNPGRLVPATSTAIHGLTDEMLADAPPIEEVLPELGRFAEDTILVGHNLAFDLQFLRTAARSTQVALTQPALDTLLLDVALYPAQADHTLEAIAARLGVSIVGRHTALGDALVTADVLVGLLGPLREAGIRTLEHALATSRRAFEARAGDRPVGNAT